MAPDTGVSSEVGSQDVGHQAVVEVELRRADHTESVAGLAMGAVGCRQDDGRNPRTAEAGSVDLETEPERPIEDLAGR